MIANGTDRAISRTLCVGLVVVSLWAAPGSAEAQNDAWSVMREARIEQELGQVIPSDLLLVDEQGKPVRIGRYFGKKPSILVLAYFSCPDLCPLTLRHLVRGLNGIGLIANRDFNVIVVSFDARDTPVMAASQRETYLRGYRRGQGDALAGWHFLTGEQAEIDRLKQAVGFHCAFDQQHDRFAHAAGVMIVTPEGRLSHCFFGVDFAPASLENALLDASAERLSAVARPAQQYCFDYDPGATGRGRLVMRLLRGLGIGWVLLLLGYIGYHVRQDRRSGQRPAARKTSHGDRGRGAHACQ